MKTRQSHVSNSSTSNFIIYGFKIKYNKIDIEKFVRSVGSDENIKRFEEELKNKKYPKKEILNEWFHEIKDRCELYGIVYDHENDIVYVGEVIIRTSENEYIEDQEIDIDELELDIGNIQRIFDVGNTPKLYLGTTAC